ncbi:MAG: hypothetical protein KDA24_16430 [Deltaproteobacteria bacterium]|nr:hypothetical protein [Deltaproteobacteria bacterium]
MRLVLLPLLLSVSLAGCPSSVNGPDDDDDAPADDDDATDALDCPPAFDVDGDYGSFDLDGWPVQMRLELLEDDTELGCEVLDRLTSDLATIRAALTPGRIDQLHTVTIWVEVDQPQFPGAVYHPSAQWLSDNGYPPEWAEGIQLGNARNYLDWTDVQPAMVLHEFSHAWHHQVVGYGDATILGAYQDAMDAGLYDAVEYATGGIQEAYATTNVQEYFAELSEAWFWTNDFYPFDREDLLSHDPVGAAAVEGAWSL